MGIFSEINICRQVIKFLDKKNKYNMDFGLAVEVSIGVENKTAIIHTLSSELEATLHDKYYGSDIKKIIIGIICVAPEFEWFSKIRKPKYTEYRKYIVDGIEIEEDRLFSFDIKLSFNSLKTQTDNESRIMLAKEIVKSLANLDFLPKKINDFNKEAFKADLTNYFVTKNLLTIPA